MNNYLPKIKKIIFNKNTNNNSGFTLIELLIVVVIIGILSGIVVTVINPISQQSRARDAVTVSNLNKIILATESYLSAYTKTPSANDFITGLSNANAISESKCSDDSCVFSLNATTLPENCDNDFYGEGENQCYFYYEKDPETNEFYIYAKSFGTDGLYIYKSSSTDKRLQICPNDYPNNNLENCTDF